MINSKKFKPLEIATILERVDDVELFHYYIPSFKVLGKPFCSELRKDNNPSCTVIKRGTGKAFYKDFSTGDVMDIFTYVSRKYGTKFMETLTIINNDFNLGLGSTKAVPKTILIHNPTLIEQNYKETNIRIKKRKWSPYKDTYWSDYKLPFDFLTKEKIFPITHYWVGDALVYKNTEKAAYTYEEGNRKRKILRPYADKRRKWTSNVPGTHLSGLEDYTTGELLIITKARKDRAVLRFLFPEIPIVSTQSEQLIKESIAEDINKRFKKTLIFFDNDLIGVDKAEQNVIKYGWKSIYVPEPFKDPSSVIKELSLNETKKMLNKIIHNE